MKHKFSLILFFVSLLALPVMAQHSADPVTLGGTAVLGGTNNSPALTTNVYDVVSVTRGQYAAIQVNLAAGSGSTSNLVVRVDTAVDSPAVGHVGAWMPNVWVFPIAANSTTTNTFTTNITVGAVGFLRIAVGNTNASGAFTNLTIRVAQKPGI